MAMSTELQKIKEGIHSAGISVKTLDDVKNAFDKYHIQYKEESFIRDNKTYQVLELKNASYIDSKLKDNPKIWYVSYHKDPTENFLMTPTENSIGAYFDILVMHPDTKELELCKKYSSTRIDVLEIIKFQASNA